jgi:hypothetical protein
MTHSILRRRAALGCCLLAGPSLPQARAAGAAAWPTGPCT